MNTSLIDKFFKKFIDEIKKKEKIDEVCDTIIEPIVKRSIESLYPYLLCGIVIIVILFILIISILFLNIKICYK